MFAAEQRRVEDAYTLHEMAATDWREDLLPLLVPESGQGNQKHHPGGIRRANQPAGAKRSPDPRPSLNVPAQDRVRRHPRDHRPHRGGRTARNAIARHPGGLGRRAPPTPMNNPLDGVCLPNQPEHDATAEQPPVEPKNTMSTPSNNARAGRTTAAEESESPTRKGTDARNVLLLGYDWGTPTRPAFRALCLAPPNWRSTKWSRPWSATPRTALSSDLLPGNAKILYGQAALKHRLHLRLVAPMVGGVLRELGAARDFARHLRTLIPAASGDRNPGGHWSSRQRGKLRPREHSPSGRGHFRPADSHP